MSGGVLLATEASQLSVGISEDSGTALKILK